MATEISKVEKEKALEFRRGARAADWEYSCSSDGSSRKPSETDESTPSDEQKKKKLSSNNNSEYISNVRTAGYFKFENRVDRRNHEVVIVRVSSSKTGCAKYSLDSNPNSQIISGIASVSAQVGVAEVIDEKGSKLMSDIKCPTVLIKVNKMYFTKAMVHYVLLEPKSGQFEGQIPALLLSNPTFTCRGETTQTAELLPLIMQSLKKPAGAVTLKPMLLYKCCLSIFRNWCEFQLKVVKIGRKYSPMRENMLKNFLFKDMQMMPIKVLRELKPLRRVEKKPPSELVSSYERLLLQGRGISSAFTPKKLSEIYPKLRLPGLNHHDFARSFETIPPNVVVDMNFKCENGIFKKDVFQNPDLLDRYLGLSRVI